MKHRSKYRHAGMPASVTLVFVVAGLSFLPSCESSDRLRRIRVATTEELVKAIGSDREITLLPGQYNLDRLASLGKLHGNAAIGSGALRVEAHQDETLHPYGPPSWWCRRYMSMEPGFLRVENMTLKGEGPPGAVELFVTDSFADVLSVYHSKKIRLENLTLGHHVEPGHCGGGVFVAWFVDDLEIVDCHLYGCGTEGVELFACNDVQLERVLISDCTYDILVAQGCRGIRVKDSTVRNVPEAMEFLCCDEVVIDSCEFYGILAEEGHAVLPKGLVTWSSDRLWLNELITDDPEILQGLDLSEPDLVFKNCRAVDCQRTELAGPWKTPPSFNVPIWRAEEQAGAEGVMKKTGFLQSMENEPLADFLPRFLDILSEHVFEDMQLKLVHLEDEYAVIELVGSEDSLSGSALSDEQTGRNVEAELLHNLLQPSKVVPGWIEEVRLEQQGQPINTGLLQELGPRVTRVELQRATGSLPDFTKEWDFIEGRQGRQE